MSTVDAAATAEDHTTALPLTDVEGPRTGGAARMLYEIPLMGLGLVSHVAVVRSLPVLNALPLPAQVGLAALPTALMLSERFFLQERLSPRASAGLALAVALLHLGLSLSLPVSLLVGTVWDSALHIKEVAPVPGVLLLVLPALLLGGLYLDTALREWRGSKVEDSR